MRSIVLMLFAALCCLSGVSETQAQESTLFSQEERVVLLGGVFCERETDFGLIELEHQLAFPAHRVSFRNLGWSGDNVSGESRAYFGPVKEGYKHLLQYTELAKPTAIYCCYGLAESYDGLAGLQQFTASYDQLLEDLSKITPRIVLVTPTPIVPEDFSGASVALKAHQKILGAYTAAIRSLAKQRGLILVDLYGNGDPLPKGVPKQLTTDGIHLSLDGYRWAAKRIVHTVGKSAASYSQINAGDAETQEILKPLVESIRLKNSLYFHRFRPQNETYLRGFRKHEQGQNAVEILEYDALIERQDEYLFETRQAVLGQLVK